MNLGPIPDDLKHSMRKHLFSHLKGQRSLEAYELDLFSWFRTETEKTWAQMDAEEQAYVREQIATGAEDVNDSGVLAVSYYCKRMRYSHVIFVASLLEGAMKRECDRLTAALGEKVLFKPSELKGDPWSARMTFLERHGSFHKPEALWAAIKDLLAVRNALVHHNGELSLLTDEQVSVLSKVPGIQLKHSEVSVEATYLDQASDSVRNLMEFVHEKTNLVIDRSVRPQAVP